MITSSQQLGTSQPVLISAMVLPFLFPVNMLFGTTAFKSCSAAVTGIEPSLPNCWSKVSNNQKEKKQYTIIGSWQCVSELRPSVIVFGKQGDMDLYGTWRTPPHLAAWEHGVYHLRGAKIWRRWLTLTSYKAQDSKRNPVSYLSMRSLRPDISTIWWTSPEDVCIKSSNGLVSRMHKVSDGALIPVAKTPSGTLSTR